MRASQNPPYFMSLLPVAYGASVIRRTLRKLLKPKRMIFGLLDSSLGESGLKEYIEEHHLKLPMYTGVTKETIGALGLGSTPQTIVVSPKGQVLKVWMGAYIQELGPEVESYFGVQLPGLTSFSK